MAGTEVNAIHSFQVEDSSADSREVTRASRGFRIPVASCAFLGICAVIGVVAALVTFEHPNLRTTLSRAKSQSEELQFELEKNADLKFQLKIAKAKEESLQKLLQRENSNVKVITDKINFAEGNEDKMPCCCKTDSCRDGSKGADGVPSQYHGELNLCCKIRSDCGTRNWGKPTAYKRVKPLRMCSPDPSRSEDPTNRPSWNLPRPQIDPSTIKEGSSAETLHKHCAKDDDDEEDSFSSKQDGNLLGHMVNELESNSLDAMAKQIFTMYACVRWAPEGSYWPIARDELENGQLPKSSKAAGDDQFLLTARAAERGNFIPLRCSENIGVYDVEEKGQHYPPFERRAMAMADFFEKEVDGAFDARATIIESSKPSLGDYLWTSRSSKKARWYRLLNETSLFNRDALSERLAECKGVGSDSDRLTVDISEDFQTLWNNCDFINWWGKKVDLYFDRFPFQAYLAGNKGSNINAGDRILFCFGKRVAGDLHRRPGGSHILTDMNGVGCHGFWDFKMAAKMVKQIVNLWAPPTCQLAELELKMKVRLLEMFSTMNKKLFESLPALIASEQFSDANPGATESSGLSAVAASGQWLVNAILSVNNKYQTLGDLLSTSVMKWSVCPVGENKGLDARLGSDDKITQKYTQEAYSKWTGKEAKLPGEVCKPLKSDVLGAGAESCEIGVLRESYPEAYKDVKFACPAIPLLPASQQLKILQESHSSKCFVKATAEQLAAMKWYYPGMRPTDTQFHPVDHAPTSSMEMVQVLDQRKRLDSLGISRDFVTLGRVCTIEVRNKYPRWCTEPELLNDKNLGEMITDGMTKAIAGTLNGLAGVADEIELGSANSTWKSWLKHQALRAGSGLANGNRFILGTMERWASSMGGASKRRYNRIRKARLYSSIEAGEALWGAAFQKNTQQTATSAQNQDFSRFATSVPCDGIDIAREIESEYVFGEAALELLSKAKGKFKDMGKTVGESQRTVSLQVRSEVELIRASQNGYPYRELHLAWKGSPDRSESTDWSVTYDSYKALNQIFKVTSRTSYTASFPNVYGLSLQYSCGRRQDIYNGQGNEFGTFLECLRAGVKQVKERQASEKTSEKAMAAAEKNLDAARKALAKAMSEADEAEEVEADAQLAEVEATRMKLDEAEEAYEQLLQEKPLTLAEYNEEIVVRVDFSELPECYVLNRDNLERLKETRPKQTTSANQDIRAEGVTANMAAALLRKVPSVCKAQAAATEYKEGVSRTSVQGGWMGSKAPESSRKEVILSPADVSAWIS
eukprot:TRINITY_DN9285_c0_g1_i1.p1 TRINITY_DN9285_c0_g1~~TRINITY_DN9285_c0_g1_i1.p1  ORF type:complete len:1265 (-),score=266.88 TRINITY_DN9285_c0_g1_i1:737-4531(-)